MAANDDSQPGVVVIQEWWNHDEQQSFAEKLAAIGYRALVLDFRDTGRQDARGAVEYMKETSSKVAMATFWNSARSFEYVDNQEVDIPFQAHFATGDDAFPRTQIEAVQKKLEQTGVRYELHWYKNTYSFADLAWQRTLDFFGKHLK